TVTEPSAKLIENMRTYDFFDDELIKAGKLHIFDLHVIYDHLGLEWGEYEIRDMDILLGAFEDIVDELSITRLVIDSITAICYQLQNRSAIRKFIFDLGKFLSTFGCTTFLISETVIEAGVEKYSVFGVEEAISDGIMLLGNINRKGDLLRTIQVVKMRGTPHSRAKHVSDLTPDGMAIVPLLKWGSDMY
ncbi:MAG: circadian clock protein KaiC, partial [Thermoplasmata archaeon]|nr:circadian clock protein KaiC [Thermoplasmata archaeon]